MENSTVIPPKIKHRINIWSSNSPSSYTPKRTKSRNLTDTCISRFTDVLFTIVSVDGWMDKQHVVIHIMKYYSGLRNFDTCYNMDESWRCYDIMPSEVSQSLTLFVTQRHIMYDSTYMRYLEYRKIQRQKIEWQNGSYCIMGKELQHGKMKTLWRSTVVMVAQRYECT